jgi:hypothetical protein
VHNLRTARLKLTFIDMTRESSTSRANRLQRPGPLDLYLPTISPGGTHSVPITINLSRPGLIDLRGILVASSVDSPDDISVATLSHAIDCQNLCSISTTPQYSRSKLGNHLVTVDITNQSATPIQLDQLRALGQYWKADTPQLYVLGLCS